MQLKDLREFLTRIPTELDEYEMVNGEVGVLDTEDPEDRYTYRVDKPIIAMYVDEETKEICFFHQTQEDVNKMFPTKNGDTEGTV